MHRVVLPHKRNEARLMRDGLFLAAVRLPMREAVRADASFWCGCARVLLAVELDEPVRAPALQAAEACRS